MDFCSAVTHHLLNPLTLRNEVQPGEKNLTPFQTTIAVVSALAVVFFGGLTPGSVGIAVLVFYTMTAYFKTSQTEKTEQAVKPIIKFDDELHIDNQTLSETENPQINEKKARTQSLREETQNNSSWLNKAESWESDSDIDSDFDSDLPIAVDSDDDDRVEDLTKACIDNVDSSYFLELKENLSSSEYIKHNDSLFSSLIKKDQLKMVQYLPVIDQKPYFNNLLNKYFDIDEMPGDGNCCVYALTKSQQGNKISGQDLVDAAKRLRTEIVKFMGEEENKNNFLAYCTYVPEERTQLEQQWIRYQEQKQKLKDSPSFRQFIANMLDNEHLSELTQILLISELNEEMDYIQKAHEGHPQASEQELNKALEAKLSEKYQRNEDGDKEVNYETYLKKMGTNGTWFGPQEITAFARKNQIPVIVYNANNVFIDDKDELHPYELSVYPPDLASSRVTPIYLYHVNGNHYNLLIPKKGIAIPPPLANKSN